MHGGGGQGWAGGLLPMDDGRYRYILLLSFSKVNNEEAQKLLKASLNLPGTPRNQQAYLHCSCLTSPNSLTS